MNRTGSETKYIPVQANPMKKLLAGGFLPLAGGLGEEQRYLKKNSSCKVFVSYFSSSKLLKIERIKESE